MFVYEADLSVSAGKSYLVSIREINKHEALLLMVTRRRKNIIRLDLWNVYRRFERFKRCSSKDKEE